MEGARPEKNELVWLERGVLHSGIGELRSWKRSVNPGHVVVAELESESGADAILSRFDSNNRALTRNLQLSVSRLGHQNLKRERLPDLGVQLAVKECSQGVQIAEACRPGVLRVDLVDDCSGDLAVSSDLTALLRQFAPHDVVRSLAFLKQAPLPNSTAEAAVMRPKRKLLIFQDHRFFQQRFQREIFALRWEDCVDLTCRFMVLEMNLLAHLRASNREVFGFTD